jgi:hypothetical protein
MDGERAEPGALVRRSALSLASIVSASLVVSAPCVWFATKDLNSVWWYFLLGVAWLSWGGLFVALEYGGYFVMRHYLARVLLWCERRAPWDYVGFLDAAVDRIFMRRIGGGYIFVHRMLMEYLAGGTSTAWER